MSEQGQPAPRYAEDFYVYTASFGNLAPAGTASVQVAVQADSTFEWIMSTWHGNLNGAAAPFSDAVLLPINIQITDSGSGRQLFSDPIPLTSIAGTGKQPFILPVSRLFQPKSNITFLAQNFMAAGTYDNLRLNLIGRKIFNIGR